MRERNFDVTAFTGRGTARFLDAFVSDAIGLRDIAFAHADQQFFLVGRDGERGGIPPGGNEALYETLAWHLDINDRVTVIVGIGDIELFAIGVDSQGVRRRSFGRIWEESRVDNFLKGAASRVDDVHGVARRAGDKQPIVYGVQDNLIRMLTDRDATDGAERVGIDRQNAAVGPVADV